MTERTGRHAAAQDAAETLIMPAQRWPADDEIEPAEEPEPVVPARRVGGRHAAGAAAEPVLAVEPMSAAEPVQAVQPVQVVERERPGPERTRHGQRARHGDRTRYREQTLPAEQALPAEPAAERRRGRRSESSLRLVWVYPDLLSTYGDRGNLLVLRRRARLRGLEVEAVEINSDEPVPGHGDIYLLGGGEDLPQILAADRLRADGGLAAAASRGAVVFAVCAGYQVLGDRFGGVEGEPVAGLSILDISSGRGDRRGVGELVADVDPALSVPRFTGFENHQGVTKLGAGAKPLARVTLGVGNGDGTEGAYAGKVLGTYMHGPALARNPGLADLLLSWAVGRLKPLDPEAEDWAGQLRAERLAAVGH
jgi:lipid II isoglutaminyl synthase (glutamine-hydrolysing)